MPLRPARQRCGKTPPGRPAPRRHPLVGERLDWLRKTACVARRHLGPAPAVAQAAGPPPASLGAAGPSSRGCRWTAGSAAGPRRRASRRPLGRRLSPSAPPAAAASATRGFAVAHRRRTRTDAQRTSQFIYHERKKSGDLGRGGVESCHLIRITVLVRGVLLLVW